MGAVSAPDAALTRLYHWGSTDLAVDNGPQPYLYRVPGSWGFSPAARPWARVLAWQRAAAARGYEPDDVAYRGRLVPARDPESCPRDFP